jgi:uncharacterized membrane protein
MNYEKIQPNRELRAYARAQLNGAWGGMAYTFFIYYLILFPSNIFSLLDSILNSHDEFSLYLRINVQNFLDINMPDFVPLIPVINNILALAVLIVAGPFALGFAGFFLKRLRGEHIAVENIFDGFKRFFPGFLTMFFTVFFTCLWSLLLVIPGIIKAFGYSMAFYIMYDNPEMKPLEALKKSQIMMKGYKFKLFLLELSFIGWMILAAIPFGLGFLWLNPYMQLSMANFYENLKRHQENNQETNQAVNQTENQTKPPIDLFQST